MRPISSTTASPSSRCDGRRRRLALDVLLEPEVGGGQRGDLGQVGDADHLAALAQGAQPLADDAGGVAADPGVDLVEDQGRRRRRPRLEAAEGEHHPRELAAGGRVAQRRRLDPRVRRHPQLDRLRSRRRRSRRGWARARPPAWRRASPAARAPSRPSSPAAPAAFGAGGAELGGELLAARLGLGQRRLSLGAALLGALEPRDLLAAALGVGEHRLDAAAVLAQQAVERVEPLLDRQQPPRVGLDPLGVVAQARRRRRRARPRGRRGARGSRRAPSRLRRPAAASDSARRQRAGRPAAVLVGPGAAPRARRRPPRAGPRRGADARARRPARPARPGPGRPPRSRRARSGRGRGRAPASRRARAASASSAASRRHSRCASR